MIINKIKNRFLRFMKSQYKIKHLSHIKKNKIIMFNTPNHGNLGDQALALAEMKFIKDNFPDFIYTELSGSEIMGAYWGLKKVANKGDIIAIHAGGFLGTLWINEENNCRKIIKTFKSRKIIIFPQTVYYSENEYGMSELAKSKALYSKCKKLVICAREKYSTKLLKQYFPGCKVHLIPDMAFYLDKFKRTNSKVKRKGVLLCLRNDKEKTQDNDEFIKECLKPLGENITYTDTLVNYPVSPNERKKEVDKKLSEFSDSKLVITDRLHGMIFAVLSETPCVVILSQSHKVKGVYEWVEDLNYIELVEEMSGLSSTIKKVLSVENPVYDRDKLLPYYKPIIDAISNR